MLLPVTLSVAEQGWSIWDTFLWPSSETEDTLESFSRQLARDNGLPAEASSVIHEHLAKNVARLKEIWERKKKLTSGPSVRTLELEVDLGSFVLRDKFQWDLNDVESAPEHFARVLSNDLALKREHEVMIAHAMRSSIFAMWEQDMEQREADVAKGVRDARDVDVWGPAILAKEEDEEEQEEQEEQEQDEEELEDVDENNDEEERGDNGEEGYDAEDVSERVQKMQKTEK